MKVRVTNLLSTQKIRNKNSEKRLINILLGKKSTQTKRDVFVRSNNEDICFSTYTVNSGKKTKYISTDILTLINNNHSYVQSEGNVHFLRDGRTFTSDQIPPINTSGLKEIKAENNCIDFGKNQYFKYVSGDGKEHYLYTNNHGPESIFSEFLRGAPYDGTLERYSMFWNYIGTAKDTVYIAERFPLSEVKAYLEEAGIQPGFFTVKMGDTETTRFYSTGKNSNVVFTQERYNELYESLTKNGGILCKYEPGSVFRIKGKAYVLSENHTLDIPYGEDIYDFEYPDNYRYGVKID